MIQKFHHGKDSSKQIPITCGLSMCINNLCPTTMTTICPMNMTQNITVLDQPWIMDYCTIRKSIISEQ